MNLALKMTPEPATSLDPTNFTVRMTDAAGKPVSGATAAIALTMPAMPMGRNDVTLHETRVGNYFGTGRFTMAGTWRATVTASHGTERASQQFSIPVR